MSSIHKDCGEPIKWAHRDDDPERFRPPLEYGGEAFIIDERGVAIMVHIYKPHMCDPAKVEAWQEYQAKLESLKEAKPETTISPYAAARERDRDETWEKVLPFACEHCGAEAGVKCWDLRPQFVNKGEKVHVKNPHPLRLAAAGLA